MARSKILKVYNGSAWLTLPYCLYTVSMASENTEAVMISGKRRMQVVGERITISGSIDYIPQTTLTAYNTLARAGGYHNVQYVNDLGATVTGYFKLTPFQPTVLDYDSNNTPIWHNVTINMEAQEVV